MRKIAKNNQMYFVFTVTVCDWLTGIDMILSENP